jgi:hypothetical protein
MGFFVKVKVNECLGLGLSYFIKSGLPTRRVGPGGAGPYRGWDLQSW